MTPRDGLLQRGAHAENYFSRYWTPSLTVVDPQILYLPLETPATPPAAPKNYYLGGLANSRRLTRGFGWVSVWLVFLFGRGA